VLIIVGIIFGAILDEIDRCQPEVKDNNTVHRHTSKENYTVNSNKTWQLSGFESRHLSKIQNGRLK
jgi:hypothetical protein